MEGIDLVNLLIVCQGTRPGFEEERRWQVSWLRERLRL